MGHKSDKHSVEWCRDVLAGLGCPDIRAAEGSKEWRETRGAYANTPDLMAGPLVGGGDTSDFYVDVFEPSGDQYVKPLAGNPRAAQIVQRAIAAQGEINLAELIDGHEQLFGTINKKLAKYVATRANTPMFGLGIYFRMTGNQYVGPLFAALESLVGLDRAFGIGAHLGAPTMGRLFRALLSPGVSTFVLSLPIEQALSFVLYIVEKSDGARVILLVNHGVHAPTHPFPAHPVVQWLRELASESVG